MIGFEVKCIESYQTNEYSNKTRNYSSNGESNGILWTLTFDMMPKTS